MPSDRTLLYLTDADVSALALDASGVREAVERAFRAYGAGTLQREAKTALRLGAGHSFQSLSAADTAMGFAALKWVGVVPPGGGSEVNVNASILLSDLSTGQVRCLMDARRATALRTAGMSAVAAQRLARRDSASIGFIGAGVQAEAHLAALADVLPGLRTLRVNSATARSAERLAQRGRASGLDAIVASAKEVVSSSDVVVTTVPMTSGFEPFVDPSWLRTGAFAAAVDQGRSWMRAGLDAMDVTVVDDEAMKHHGGAGSLIPPLDHAQATLADLACGRHAGRGSARERTLFVSSGTAVADLAIALLIHERALAEGAGTRLAT